MKMNTIQRLVSNGQYKEAISSYSKSFSSSLQPDNFTFPFLLKACSNLQLVLQTQQVHSHIVKSGFQADTYTATALINAYMKLCLSEDALKVFETIPNPMVPSLNALISGFSQCGKFEESLYYFKRINLKGFYPKSHTIASVLPACQALDHGSQIHGLAIKLGHESDVYVATALITMYSSCRETGSAQQVFEAIEEKSIVTYNAMISGFLQNCQFSMALALFREVMVFTSERPSTSTLLGPLTICSKVSSLILGKEIHCYALKRELSSDTMIATTIVDMYSKCGSLIFAYRVFASIENRNIATWNAMVSSYLSHGCVHSAIILFYKLRLKGLKPDSATWNLMISGLSRLEKEAGAFKIFSEMQLERTGPPSLKVVTSLLQACSSISSLKHGKEIHCHVIRTEAAYQDEFLDTALISMYMNCGCSAHARRIFDRFEWKSKDPAIWNAMISGYGRNGENESAIGTFQLMQEKNVKPNSATFRSVIFVCAHTGRVQLGWQLFGTMSEEYGVKPTAEHFRSMVNLLGRAGELDKGWELINEMLEPSASMYHTLLGACKYYCDAELGELVAERLSELEPGNPAVFVILSGIYAAQGRWNDAEKLRQVISDRGLIKLPGRSWI